MGSRTRIRWTNVARLAAAAIGCTALVMGLPALLERPKPPPLPEDIGLTQARHAPPPTPTGSPRGRDHAKPRHEEDPPRPQAHHDRPEPQRPHRHERPADDSHHTSRGAAPATVAAPAP